MRPSRIAGALAAALLLTGAAFLPATETSSRSYVVGAKDVLDIQVYEQPDLTRTVRVSEEGRINLPLIGEVAAAGLTVESLTKVLTDRYTEFIRQPQITVYVKEYFPKEVYVLGEVRSPGILKITGNPTILELLSQAGGVTDSGASTLQLLRRSVKGKETETISINLAKLLGEGRSELNLEVYDGDTIYIPRADYFFVFGEVSKQGPYKLEKDYKINVLKAISMAGGFTEKAAKGKVKITREEDGAQSTFKVDLNTEVKPNDIIIVPESFF